MTTRAGFVTGTALALLMATGHAFAAAATTSAPPPVKGAGLMLAQAASEDDEERARARQAEPEEAAPQPPAEEPQEMPEAEEAPTPQEAPAERPAEGAPPAAEEPASNPANDNNAAPEPAERPAAPEQPAPPPADDEQAAPEPRERPADASEPRERERPARSRGDGEKAAPTPGERPADASEPRERERPARSRGDGDEAAPTPGERPADASEQRDRERPARARGDGEKAAPTPGERPADASEQRDRERPARSRGDGDEAAPTPGERPDEVRRPRRDDAAGERAPDAPILDSAKDAEGEAPADASGQPQESQEPAAPPPTTDAEAQQLEAPVEVQSLRQEEGRRIERRQERRERREGVDVLREIGDRLVIELGGRPVVQSDDRRRLEHDASEVYYEELPRGRTRETVVRPNGVQVVTIRDRYGDIVRRSRIMPDGREHVLVYAGGGGDGRARDERRGWRDPGLDLPPLRLGIPAQDYILDARRADDTRTYYDFLEQPPVEPVRRLYSVDEVRYSALVRDSVRRIDLDTITFDFGSASIAEDAIPRLETLAEAIGRLLDENPAETFLIEGHTDAVGSDLANLALSDRRAESVAQALTDVFGLPPENLVTQGYGERYLKVNTQEPEQENRRVAVRRITPLVAPVAAR
jgi:outer membrane protein OmpA-like peptidoglycan-associated protein